MTKILKVALLGNMNNNNFALMRFLLDAGIDAYLFLLDEFQHFIPEADSYNSSMYLDRIHQLNWTTIGHWKISRSKIKHDMESYNFFIATDRAISYLYKAGIRVDIFLPHGGDIFYLPFFKFSGLFPKKWEIGAWYQSLHQKKGIQKSKNIFLDNTNDEFELLFQKLKYKNKRHKVSFPIVYHPQYFSTEFTLYSKQSKYVKKMLELKKLHGIVILNLSRQVWTGVDNNFHLKGNDRLFRAFAKFLKETGTRDICIVAFEYGYDYEKSKELVKDLQISEFVYWMPKLERKDIMPLIAQADVIASEFVHSWLLGGVISEALIMSKPLLGVRKDANYSHYDTLYPLLNASNEEDILEKLKLIYTNPQLVTEIGTMAHKWYIQKIYEFSLKKMLEIIKEFKTSN